MLNALDHITLRFFNQWAQRWPDFDSLVVLASNSDLIKGGAVMATVWGAWFVTDNPTLNRRHLLSGIVGALVALFVARVLAAALPLRLRPVLDPSADFRPPIGLPDQSNWTTWSSFPSDHAALFCALAAGVWMVSKKSGTLLFLYVGVMILLPRIYVGIHYFSDILIGGLLGMSCVALLAVPRLEAKWTAPLLRLCEKKPTLFYAIFFMVAFQVATLFWDIRILLNHFGFSS